MSREATRPRSFSIRRRLLVGAIAALGTMLVVLGWVSAIYARQAADSAFDRLLAASALTIAGAVQADDSGVTLELPFAALSMLGFGGDDRIFYQVLDLDGAPVTGYADLGQALPPARNAEPDFEDRSYRGEQIRLVTVGRLIAVGDRTGWITVRVGQTRDARTLLGASLTRRALWGLLALAMVALALVALGVQRALRPLRTIEADLRGRAQNDLAPLRSTVPVEVGELVAALNDFMARLATVFGRMSSLLADAAHQVRTPLASLRAQAEIALEENDPARLRDRLGRIHANAVQASQLVSQILMDATVMHRLESRETAPVPAGQILEDALKALDPAAAERLRTVIAPGAERATVAGDRVALREMLRNLIENALTHAPGGPVEVTLAQPEARSVVLAVLDRGPGIPEDEKEAVLQRFRRGRGAREGSGSGLGLAIVEAVATGHGGALALRDRPGGGLAAEVTLPAHAAESRPGVLPPATAAMGLALIICFAWLGGHPALAADPAVTRYPAPSEPGLPFTIAGTTDRAQFEPIIRGFQKVRPDVAVTYLEFDTAEMQQRLLAGTIDPAPDLLISSAIDLQVKLANDGHALRHASAETAALPSWARWRDEVFGFTFEPAVIVYNPDLVKDPEVLRTRTRLARYLRDNVDTLRGRVATYDIVRSGVGMLLAAQDAQISSTFWHLASALGETSVQLMCCSGDMIDRVDKGDFALAYNVIGPYAEMRRAAGARIGIVLPRDYTLVLSRAMLVPRNAQHPALATAFVDYVLSPRGQAVVAGEARLGAILGSGPGTAQAIAAEARGPLQPIVYSAALMTFLDQRRLAKFLQTWLQIVSGP
jgi:two-component system sensor histidine kinase TctE